ncbi:MAG: hypothetical protein FJZ90_00505 [Chloroflexi bacterium]|nr:hypothetical protein [Chloroflexota bacterium]
MYDPKLHLFLDNREIQDCWGFKRVLNQASRYQRDPIMLPEYPWEGQGIIRPTVMHDAATDSFRMWYQTYNRPLPDPYRWMVCYATSSDGLHWDKPSLGLVDYEGSRENNIVYCPREFQPVGFFDNPVVVCDALDPDPERRYKMTFYLRHADPQRRHAIYCATSPDGLRWQANTEPMLPGLGDRHRLIWDERIARWVLTTRPEKAIAVRLTGFGTHRVVARTESADLRSWSPAETIMKMEDEDAADLEFYSMMPFNYGGQYVGLLEAYSTGSESQCMELCSSWDGIHWSRVLRGHPILPLGSEGDWDDTRLATGENAPLLRGDWLWMWYDGWRVGHGPQVRPCAIGLVTLRRDAFAGMSASRNLGQLVTEPVEIAAPHLLVNIAPHGGAGWVALLDEAGQAIAGYSKEDCAALTEDRVDAPVLWTGGDLSRFRGQRLRLCFYGHNISLWAYRFADQPVPDEG